MEDIIAQLAATAQGLSMQPISQALQEYPEQAAHYQAVHQLLGAAERGHTVQMWTRLGHAPAIGPAITRSTATNRPSSTDLPNPAGATSRRRRQSWASKRRCSCAR